MKEETVKFITKFSPEFVIAILFIIFQFQYINLDFWNDEIYTLKHFTFTSTSNIFLDYHVPNNHILFNLINHIYLSIIGIDNLFQLMDHPIILRVIPFIYSALTLIFTYKIASKFYTRTIALLALSILITTIPFLNFSLQIRGYGLSSLFLLMFVYYGLSYLKKPGIKTLVKVVLTVTLLVYTIPSNLYFIFSFLLVYGIYFSINHISKRINKNSIPITGIDSKSLFKVIIATIIGLILVLILFAPIFKDVFMNKYVLGGKSFEFVKLQFYIQHLFEGIVSGRWIIFIIASFGFLMKVINREKWSIYSIIFVSILVVPLMLVFLRGDTPPLRVFVVVLPFTSILIASGISQFWVQINKMIPLHNYYLIFGIITYSLLILPIEQQQIRKSVRADIETGNRSQDLYRQYFTHHYQPLLDVNELSIQYQKEKLPILIYGCEPHGIPNYLEKFNLSYYTKTSFDSILLTNKKFYIITNHPYPFTELVEYASTPINSHLTYHNTLIFERKAFVKNSLSKIDSLQQQFGDSIGFVFHSFNNEVYSSHLNPTSTFHITNDTQLGDLISFTHKKSYICYLSTLTQNASLYHTIVHDSHKLIQNLNTHSNESNIAGFQLLKTDTISSVSTGKSEKLDSVKQYSTVTNLEVAFATNHLTYKVSFNGYFIENSKGIVVLSIDRGKKPIVWSGQGLNKFYQSKNKSQRVVTAFDINKDLLPGDQIKIYVWNSKKETIEINDFRIELISK